jgi:multidrug resistance efflux pump
MRFADIERFAGGREFFLQKPSPGIAVFILLVLTMLCGTIVWSLLFSMDDVIKADAFLRPFSTISIVKPIIGGELLKKSYVHDSYVLEGETLLQIDSSSDTIELENSKKLMDRINKNIRLNQIMLETINNNSEIKYDGDWEASIKSGAYLAEYRRQEGQIEIARIKAERERTMPLDMTSRQRIEDLEKELRQVELSLAAWRNNQLVTAVDTLKGLMQEQENLERRTADLERNIRNATLLAPVSGRINEIRKLNSGDYVMAGEEIIHIIPDNEEYLKAQLRIDAAYVARVKVGQSVTLRFPGLPPSKFGQVKAKVDLIPADYNIGTDLTTFFLVEATVNDPWLFSSTGEKIRLQPGIGAQGRIIVDQDTAMRMFLKKLDFIN